MTTLSISYNLLSLPPLVLLCILIIFFSLAGGLGTYFFRKHIKIRILNSHNDVTGNVFAMVGGFYGLLLAFVVFLVWDQFNDAQKNSDIEGSLARSLYRDIKFFPASPDSGSVTPEDVKMLTFIFSNYVKDVITEDSLLDKQGPESPWYVYYRDTVTIKSFNKLFEIIERMNDKEDYKNRRIDQMFRQLNELSTYRSLRGLSSSSEINIYIWVPLWLGGFITAIFAMMMDIENRRLHIFMNSLLGAFIALIFYIIILSDHPFNGTMRIEVNKSIGKILEWEESGMMEHRIKTRH